MDRQRDYGLDLTRAVAAVLVLAVHFFMNSGFYDVPLQGVGMALSTVVRMACMVCVPLFIMLTGYLCSQKTWKKGYYWGLLPVLLTYLLAAIVCMAFRVGLQGEHYRPVTFVLMFFEFSAAPYGWYVEMYIGLFLLTPFLNAAWNALPEKGRKALVLVLLVMTVLPTLTNARGPILPDWWTGIYPLTYYCLGAWLREHPLKLKKRWLLLGWLGLAAVAALGQFAMQRLLMPDEPFRVIAVTYWAGVFTVGESVCLFSLLRGFDGSSAPKALRWCVSRVAALSLPIYLMSYIADQLVYPILNTAVPAVAARLPFILLTVLCSLVLSAVMAQLIDWAVKALLKLVPRKKVTV